MMRRLLFLLLVCLLVSCTPTAAAQLPAVALDNPAPTRTPGYIVAPPNATPTPTPFQPLLPTPAGQSSGSPAGNPAETPVPPPTEVNNAVAATPTAVPPQPEQSSQQKPKKNTLIAPEGQINILLLGSDQRPWDSGFRTDTIILATINPELGRVNLTSFPRDLFINVPGWGAQRINTAYRYGGIELLKDTFKTNFGVRPQHYVLINFSSFKKVIDSLGGLEVVVGEPLSDYRYGYWTNIPAGPTHMDADTVLWYVRSRKTSNDFARNRRQQEVLQAIFEKLLSMDAIKRAPEFYAIYKESVTTDLGLKDMIIWLPLAAKIAESRDIHHYYVDHHMVSDWITPDGAMVLLPNMDKVMALIRKSQNIP